MANTNLRTTKRQEELILCKKYNPEEFPKYDNCRAIEVSKMIDISCNCDGVMSVSITFLNKYDSLGQFETACVTNRRKMAGIRHKNNNCFAEINRVLGNMLEF